ncbi:7TM diverse intracellular signaling domain-containing protein [Olivibacter sp. SDN3]|uniref:7TM diverse intracellular signaling domain-containing protein n=1 Tax=Olivibacter sp. SDN3 TaxID=2764720 RepID=UPI002103CE6D|nr:7TM diverse intracellular signaling domain-containing protein [Olivibacter sp. SDN3]
MLLCSVWKVRGQQPVVLTDSVEQHMFTFGELRSLKDERGMLSFKDVLQPEMAARFQLNDRSTPQNEDIHAYYWYKITIDHHISPEKLFVLEFFDQTIDEIEAYLPNNAGGFDTLVLGDNYAFSKRPFLHKNFVIPLYQDLKGQQDYYFRIQSRQLVDAIIVVRSIDFFVEYALGEYFSFGIFYGMILVFSFYNLIMFFAVKQRAYLYYVCYMLCVALFEMCTDGIAYHYLWPNWSAWNQYAFGVVLCLMSVSALLFTQRLLLLQRKAPKLNTIISVIIGLRILYLLYALLWHRSLLNYKFMEAIPLLMAFGSGIYIWWRGYRPARYFVIGYGFLFIGYSIKLMIMLGFTWLNFGIVSYYCMSFCFILEMTFLSLAVGDRVRVMKNSRDKAQQLTIKQMQINQELKDSINKDLEQKVKERTSELVEKSHIISEQNLALSAANRLLEEQKNEITRMNALLNKDNALLKVNVEEVTRARALSKGLDFEEFSKAYPDQESCLRFLAGLKWKNGYCCRKCAATAFYIGHLPHSRRCAHCGYEESATAHTVLQHVRIPINKSFYLIYLLYSTKGRISSHKLAEVLGIRQSTCWAYSKKIKQQMEQKKMTFRNASETQGWSELLV